MNSVEIQLDRVVGPLHHFGGLGLGNLASQQHAGQVSHPAAAALEGLDKMRLVSSRGVPQLILPPQRRPAIGFLRSLGFAGNDSEVRQSALEMSPQILSAACSSSAMWTANAATVTAAADNRDGRLKLTVANLSSSIHRSLEPNQTRRQLKRLFRALSLSEHIDVYPALDRGFAFRDEGAANHLRLSAPSKMSATTSRGLNVFVFGDTDPLPSRYLARQSRFACEAIARRHGLGTERTFFLKQHPEAIDAGAFHNDVVTLSHEDLLIHHERAFWQADPTLDRIARSYQQTCGVKLNHVVIPEAMLSLDDAISTYLFNSQIVTTSAPNRARVLICPSQVRDHASAMALVQTWRDQERWFDEIHFVSVKESMAGGGGPACLRLRIPVEEGRITNTSSRCWWSESTDEALRMIIHSSYPKQLMLADLADPTTVGLAQESTRRIEEFLS